MAFTLRPATPNDAEAIARVHLHMWRTAYRGLLPDAALNGLSMDGRVESWQRILARAAEQPVWVVEVAGAIAGFVGAGPTRDDDEDHAATGEVYAIYVDRERTGPGAGHALFTTAVAWLASRGYISATLWVLEGNVRAIHFYEQHGWAHDGSIEEHAIAGLPSRELRYRVSLSRPAAGA